MGRFQGETSVTQMSVKVEGLRHVRTEGKGSDAKGDESESKFDSHWQERLKGQDSLEVMAAKDKIDAAATEALDPHVRKIRDEKYGWKFGCGAKGCTKLFHAAEFVYKHLKLKHIGHKFHAAEFCVQASQVMEALPLQC